MEIALEYHGIKIIYEYGFYSPIVDLSVCEFNVSKIMLWIDDFLGIKPVVPKISLDPYIIGDFVMRKPYLNN